ncbi:MAG TPA: MFS transporter [Candidatus Krumholzibacteriaceae bacterium]|nr:MFS transporter [Candidatus Krumholzibacteriaceae bacterium]
MNLVSDKVGRSVFWTLCVMGAFAILSSTMSKTLLNPFATALNTPNNAWSGFAGAASTIPGILVSLPASSLSDIYGRRKLLMVSGFVFATAPFLYLFISVWWQLIFVRFYHGFATAIFVPVAEASMAELFPSQRGERISLFMSATYIGRSIAPFLGGYILFSTASTSAPLYNYHIMYLAVAAAGLAAFVLALLFLAEKKPPTVISAKNSNTKRRMHSGWGALMKDRSVLAVSFVQASLYYSFGTVDYFLSGYLKTNLHFDFFSTAAVSGSIIVLAIFVRVYMGRVSDRIGRRKPMILGLLICSVPLVIMPFSSDLRVLLLLALVYGFGFATATAPTSALITELVPREFIGTSTGFLDTVMDVGQTAGPIIGGFILGTSLGYFGLFLSPALVLFAACLVLGLSRDADRRTSRGES